MQTLVNVSRRSSEDHRRNRTRELFTAIPELSPVDREAAVDEVVRLNMPVAERVAARFARRGIPEDDLRQVAYLALTRAAQKYDAERAGSDFLSYAVPTMRGEVRKYFRDHGWMVRPTRRVQEIQARANKSRESLTSELGRTPTIAELAEHLGEPAEDVREAMAADGCFAPTSLDAPVGSDSDEGLSPLGTTLGADDDGMLAAEARASVQPLLRNLAERDRLIVALRFYEGLTQREIAERIGVTQMQVSRLLARILGQMRASLESSTRTHTAA
ncbi:sigma-70 family RNA polymerase sigma factor [Nocardioides marmoraquaticus]